MAKNLTLVPDQKKELERDLIQESFLKNYEKVPGYKTSFEFKNKMFAFMRSQRASLVPLFKLRDEIGKVKWEMDDTLDSCGAVVLPRDNPEAGYSSWGQETVSVVFRPLQSPPQVEIAAEVDKLELLDLELDPAMVETIQERVRAKLKTNKVHAKKAVAYSNGLFMKTYDSLAKTANVTSDSI